MSRLDALKNLRKIAQSYEQYSEEEKIRQTEKRVGMSLADFENKVGSILISKSLKRAGFEFDEINAGGRIVLERILSNPEVWSDDRFEYPYDFLQEKKTPEEYVAYLERKNIILS
tara:strand:- start:7695 stop:8039 length:345 start_codon:yes stop_codon:yes gene_type:complete